MARNWEDELAELMVRPKSDGWGFRVQNTSKALWKAASEGTLDPQIRTSFIQLLRDRDAYLVARLVIADLRVPGSTQLEGEQRLLREAIKDICDDFTDRPTQSSWDDDLYREEKDVFLNAEAYRASILLYDSGILGPTNREAIQLWLSQRPGAAQSTNDRVS